MDVEFWLERWHRREIGWHRNEINAHLQEFWPSLALDRNACVFVPLCGKTLDLIWLVGQGHRVIGVELAEVAVREIFAEQGLTPTVTEMGPFRRYQLDELVILCGDFFDLKPEHLNQVDAVFDRASLIALPPEMRRRYADKMASLMPSPVPTLLVSLEYDQKTRPGPPFAVHRDEVETLFGDRYRIEPLARLDVLAESPNNLKRGLTSLHEQAYRLSPRV
ncbi:thiopurine S-methyltransferase [Imhoffiella purpurea]|nr:thiopurine S-methyltransferase [Imhoffiella purpurea]